MTAPLTVDPVQFVGALVLVGLASAALGLAVAGARTLRERASAHLRARKSAQPVPAGR